MDLKPALTVGDFEQRARDCLDPAIWAYLAGGAGEGRTIEANRDAYGSVLLCPRVPSKPCDAPDASITLFGQTVACPVLLAPTSPQRLFHPDAEVAVARAACAAGAIAIVSADSHFAFDQISEAGGKNCWFQLYAYTSRAHVERMIEMAVTAGARALVVTMDACYPARRIMARRAGFSTPRGVDFGILRELGVIEGGVPEQARIERLRLIWDDISWIRAMTPIPLLIKGVLHGDDAARAVQSGADGIIVSNHGGRQLDGAVATLEALEQVVARVGDQCVTLVDGSVRSGVDVVKAIALGARGACIGRPYLWGLATGGESGVRAVLEMIASEVEDTILQLGLTSLSDVGPGCIAAVRWQSSYSRNHTREERVYATHSR